jgi:iron complex outermembrane receptor protein
MRPGFGRHLVLAALPLFAASAALAQQPAADSTNNEPVKLDKFVVTGSYIPAAADEALALPVQIVDSKAIELTGVTKSVLDVLRKAVPQIIGGNNIGVENGNVAGNSTQGGSAIALRNTATLVLIDGQRVAFDPVSGSGGVQFVDLNVVPVSAVERIEVLTDGASAIYGSDAVSGVVNIILKKNYQGLEMGGYYGFTKSDKTGATYRERVAHIVGGASTDKTNITMSFEWSKSDPLYEKDYNYTGPVFLTTSYAGVINDAAGQFYKLNPSLNAPPAGAPTTLANLVAAGVYVPVATGNVPQGFDLSHIPTFLGALDKKILSVALDHKVNDNLTFKSALLYSQTSNQYQLNPQPITLKVNSTTDPTTVGLPGIPFTDPNVTVRNRFVSYNPRVYINDTDSIRGTAEFDGKIGNDWNWTVSGLYNQSKQNEHGNNLIVDAALKAGIRAGQINLAAIAQNPVLFPQANIFGDSIAVLTSKIIAYDARVSGQLFELPAGAVAMAAGVGYRKETLNATADANSITNPATGTSAWNNGVSLSPIDAARDIKSGFVELKVPITSPQNHIPGFYTVSLDGAIRHEIYSDTDDPTVPKISLRWMPVNDEFAVRSTYSKSFAAPTLFSLFGPTNSGATPSLVGITAYNASGVAIGTFPPVQGSQQSGSNPNLKPSRSKNYTAGFIYSPKALKGFSISVDYYNIKESDLVGALATTTTIIQDVEQFGPASVYANFVHLGNFGQLGGTLVTAPGQLHANPTNVYVDQFPANVATQKQDGLDITLKYDWTTHMGTFDLTSTWAYLRSFEIEPAAGQGFTDFTNTNGFGTLPRYREYTSLSWTQGAYTAAVTNTFIPSVISAGDGVTKIPSYTSFDVQGTVELGKVWNQFGQLKLTVGINNVFAKYPPVDPTVFSDPPADTGTYGSFGRFYYMDLTYKF